eukprot:TRINITY_DN5192_c0_g1_i10.p1 TRINITY_DN5192_c0_g1~~TRINITY_DN5192_c0_g1_i10.p1  ORF type:complete len:163 (+),score=33.68 TRINITY_DN5192_c0_g1_i10:97-585(+)
MIRRPPRSTQSRSSAASDVYKRQTDDLSIHQFAHRLQSNEDLTQERKTRAANTVKTLCTRQQQQTTITRTFSYLWPSQDLESSELLHLLVNLSTQLIVIDNFNLGIRLQVASEKTVDLGVNIRILNNLLLLIFTRLRGLGSLGLALVELRLIELDLSKILLL